MPQSSAPPPCDLQLDYAAHLGDGRHIGSLPREAWGSPVAVIGSGGAGLCAAYELLRIGCRPTLYEAETSPEGPGGRRLGGRMHGKRLAPADSAVVELGCMRFPDSASLLWQYADRFGLHTRPFRDNYAHPTTPVTTWHVDGKTYPSATITDLHAQHEEFRKAHTAWLAALDGSAYRTCSVPSPTATGPGSAGCGERSSTVWSRGPSAGSSPIPKGPA
ncbi:FAD-dependent oxidoreductase [Streptomyces sp. NPDC056508]|uniref:FAD-dependent oxidoreductase n=1 Tax=Streptomyces sp. NPDC056508 TaxID=3345845 RepID=UPI00368E674B